MSALADAESDLLIRGLCDGLLTDASWFVTAHAHERDAAIRLFESGHARPVLAGINVPGCNFQIFLTKTGLLRALSEIDHWTLLELSPERRERLAALERGEYEP